MKKTILKLKNNIKKDIIENSKFYKSLCAILMFFIIVFGGIIMNCIVPSESMSPTLEARQVYIANRLAYVKSSPQRYDVVVFKAPDSEHDKYVKRIIGLPGELVNIDNKNVNIDNKKLDEPYLKEKKIDYCGVYYVPKKGDEVILQNARYDEKGNVINADCYIGDNFVGGVVKVIDEEASDDENIKYKKIDFLKKYCKKEDGKYIIKEDTYFLMGDNRNDSLDSRFWDYTYVKKSKILAKYAFTYLKF